MKWKLEDGIKLSVEEIKKLVTDGELKLPTYASPLINLANRFAQATRPKVVGKMSELIKECPYRDFEGWKKWYMSKHPNAIEEATNRIMEMLKKFKDVIDRLDRETVKKWVEDLILVKTYIGLRVQEPILSYFSRKLGETYRLAIPEEESKGIDGYIGEYSVSIKKMTYKDKRGIAEERPSGDVVIYYEKDEDNNIVILEIESLTEKGDEFIERVRKLFKTPSLDDFY